MAALLRPCRLLWRSCKQSPSSTKLLLSDGKRLRAIIAFQKRRNSDNAHGEATDAGEGQPSTAAVETPDSIKAGRPVAVLKPDLPRKLSLGLGHPWVYDDEISNIGHLTRDGGNRYEAGTVVDVVNAVGEPHGVGLLNRQASITVRLLSGLVCGADVTQDVLRQRVRAAFAARDAEAVSVEFCRAVHGEADGLPGLFVDRFGTAAVIIFVAFGSARLQFMVQEELTRWIGGRLSSLAVHRMAGKKEKWAQGNQAFVTELVRGDSGRIAVSDFDNACDFELDVHQGLAGHWNYALEAAKWKMMQALCTPGTVLDAWSHLGQLGIRCAKNGASEVVLLEESLAFAKLCGENATRNGVDMQCTVLHRSDILDELRSMASSGIRFNVVALNMRVKFQYYFKQRYGEFGRWFKPSLKGYEVAVRLGTQVTARGGFLIATFHLPLASEHWAVSIMKDGIEKASRTGSIIYHVTALDENAPLASSAMDDAWSPVIVCARLN